MSVVVFYCSPSRGVNLIASGHSIPFWGPVCTLTVSIRRNKRTIPISFGRPIGAPSLQQISALYLVDRSASAFAFRYSGSVSRLINTSNAPSVPCPPDWVYPSTTSPLLEVRTLPACLCRRQQHIVHLIIVPSSSSRVTLRCTFELFTCFPSLQPRSTPQRSVGSFAIVLSTKLLVLPYLRSLYPKPFDFFVAASNHFCSASLAHQCCALLSPFCYMFSVPSLCTRNASSSH